MNNFIKTILGWELEQKNLVYPFVAGLTQREKAILSLREQGKPLSLIGEKLSLSRERVRQIEEKANEKIKYQKDIIQTLADKLGEVLFEENEIEKALKEYLKGKTYPEMKLEWVKFNKILWKNKKND